MNRKAKKVCAVILAAGNGTRLNSIINGLYKPLIKVAGCPAIIHIARSLIQQGINDFVIVANETNKQAIENAWGKAFENLGLNLTVCVQPLQLGPAHALFFGASGVDDEKSILICLSDTLFNQNLSFDTSWVGTAKVTGIGKWCWAENKDGRLKSLYDKIQPPPGVKDVLVGLYYFESAKYLKVCLGDVISENIKQAEGEYQLSSVINLYRKKIDMNVVDIDTWVDVGSVENYKNAQYKFLQYRSHNNFQFMSDNKDVIIKSGPPQKIQNEINWLKTAEKIFPDLILKIYNKQQNSYEMDYCKDTLISKIFLYENLPVVEFMDIITKLLLVGKNMWSSSPDPSSFNIEKECTKMYIEKPIKRLREWDLWTKLKKKNEVVINNQIVDDIYSKMQAILSYIKENHKPIIGAIHGDFHFGNIFFNETDKSFKLIDPRGSFGDYVGVLGDVYYDLAKLRHSYHGMYDAILDGLYIVSYDNENGYNLIIGPQRDGYIQSIDNKISSLGYNLDFVKIIEFTILISLIPLHNDSPKNQLVFFLEAMILMEEIYNTLN